MTKNANQSAFVMDVVRRHANDLQTVTAKQLAFALGWDEQRARTIYNWMAGTGLPDTVEVNLWLRCRELPEAFRRDVATAQLAGSGLTPTPCDVDVEGKSSVADAIDLNVSAAHFAKAIQRAEADGDIDAAEHAQLMGLKNEMVAMAERIIARGAGRKWHRVG